MIIMNNRVFSPDDHVLTVLYNPAVAGMLCQSPLALPSYRSLQQALLSPAVGVTWLTTLAAG